MARVYLTNLNLSKNELQNAVVQVLASAPSSPAEGQIYYNSADHKAYIYNGTTWQSLDSYTAISFGTPGNSAVGDSAAAGVASTAARSDHTHGRESFGASASTQAIGDSASGGAASTPSRSDHKHAMPAFGSVSAQTTFGASSGDGSASSIAKSDHTHGTPAHDASAHSSIKISDLAAPTASVAFNSQKITGLADPSSDQDAATKSYVDSAINGLSWKDSVAVASSSDVTISGPGSTIDGVSLSSGDRVLLYGQSTGSQNGIYVFNGAAAAMTRPADADTAAELKGAAVFVERGTDADKQFVMTTDSVTLGTTSLTWTQFGATSSYTDGAGLTLTGSTFAVGAGTGITVNANDVAIDTSVVARYKSFTITGDGSSTYFDLTHSLQQFVSVQVVDGASPYDQVECDVERTSATACRVKFATAPANAKTYKVIVIG